NIRHGTARRRPVVRVDAALALGVRSRVRNVEPALSEQQRAVRRETLGLHLGLLPAQGDERGREPVALQRPLPEADHGLDQIRSGRRHAGTFSGSFSGSGARAGSGSGSGAGAGSRRGTSIGSTVISLAGPGSVAAGSVPSSRMSIG